MTVVDCPGCEDGIVVEAPDETEDDEDVEPTTAEYNLETRGWDELEEGETCIRHLEWTLDDDDGTFEMEAVFTDTRDACDDSSSDESSDMDSDDIHFCDF